MKRSTFTHVKHPDGTEYIIERLSPKQYKVLTTTGDGSYQSLGILKLPRGKALLQEEYLWSFLSSL